MDSLGAFLRTDVRYIAVQGSWLASGQALNNILSIVLTIAFANLISKEMYGSYKYILSLFGLLSLATLSDMGTAVIKTVAEGFEGVNKKVFLLRVKFGLLGTIAALGIAGYYFYHDNALFGYSFILVAIFVPFFDPVSTYNQILAGKKRFDLQTKYYMLTRIVSAASVILALFISKHLLVLLVAYFLPYVVMGLILGPRALRKLDLNNKFDPGTVTYGKHLSLLALISVGVGYLDSIIVFHFLGAAKLALYSIAIAPANRLQSLFGIIPEIALPKFTERPMEDIKENIGHKMLRGMLITGSLVVLYILAVPIFFNIFLPQYTDSIRIAQLYSIHLIWYPLIMISRILSAKGAVKYIYYYNMIGSFVQIGVMLSMIYYFGLIGAVLGRLIMSIFGNSLMYYYFKKL